LRVYWVTFSGNELGLGCGVTAIDPDDVRRILGESDYVSESGAVIDSIREVAFEDIEQNHVVPNMGNFFMRGIWYPRGV
jgi:hypothetical protein